METLFQHWLVTQFILPILLIFGLLYGVLVKTKIFGENKQLCAIVAVVVALIFVSFAYPKIVVSNLILFFVIALVTLFVGMVLWGMIAGEAKFGHNAPKIIIGLMIFVAVILALLWATGANLSIFDFLFNQGWSEMFWTNFLLLIVIGGVIALVLWSSK